MAHLALCGRLKWVGLLWKPTRVLWTSWMFELSVNLVLGRFNICSGPWVGLNQTRFQLNGIRSRQMTPKDVGSGIPITKLCQQRSRSLRRGFSRWHNSGAWWKMASPGGVMGRRLQRRHNRAKAILKTAPVVGTTPKRRLNCSDPQTKNRERHQQPFAPCGVFSPALCNDPSPTG